MLIEKHLLQQTITADKNSNKRRGHPGTFGIFMKFLENQKTRVRKFKVKRRGK